MKKGFMKAFVLCLAIVMAVGVCATLTACGEDNSKDLDYIKEKGTLIVGVTDYPPMDFQETEGGDWVGFDADMAKLLGKELGVKVEFVEIDWEQKITELKSKKIDVIWNGMTISDTLAKSMDFSYSYATNSQVAVIKTSNAGTFTTLDSMKGAKIAVESNSAGELVAKENFNEDKIVGLQGQMKALQEVVMGTSDVAIVDFTLAASQCGQGSFAELKIVDGLKMGEEEFAVGIRKGSPLTEEVNKCLVKYYKDGTMNALRVKYGKDKIALCDLSNK